MRFPLLLFPFYFPLELNSPRLLTESLSDFKLGEFFDLLGQTGPTKYNRSEKPLLGSNKSGVIKGPKSPDFKLSTQQDNWPSVGLGQSALRSVLRSTTVTQPEHDSLTDWLVRLLDTLDFAFGFRLYTKAPVKSDSTAGLNSVSLTCFYVWVCQCYTTVTETNGRINIRLTVLKQC